MTMAIQHELFYICKTKTLEHGVVTWCSGSHAVFD